MICLSDSRASLKRLSTSARSIYERTGVELTPKTSLSFAICRPPLGLLSINLAADHNREDERKTDLLPPPLGQVLPPQPLFLRRCLVKMFRFIDLIYRCPLGVIYGSRIVIPQKDCEELTPSCGSSRPRRASIWREKPALPALPPADNTTLLDGTSSSLTYFLTSRCVIVFGRGGGDDGGQRQRSFINRERKILPPGVRARFSRIEPSWLAARTASAITSVSAAGSWNLGISRTCRLARSI